MRVQVIVLSPRTHITYNWEQGHQQGRKEGEDKKRDGFCSPSVSQCQKQYTGGKRSPSVQMKARSVAGTESLSLAEETNQTSSV